MKALALAALSSVLALPALALDVPYLSGRVNDEARLLDDASAQKLEQTLKAYEEKTGRQVVVLTIPSLEGAVLEEYSHTVARTWKIGRKDKNDGVLILVARDDRKARIEVGYGLEGILPDALAGRIIRDQMVPRFRAGDYAGGITSAVGAVLGVLEGSYSPPPDVLPSRDGRDVSDLNLSEKLLMSAFVFGVLGIFEFVGVMAPGVGWFLYFFLIPFWGAFPMAIWGARVGLGLLAAHLIGFPILKMLLPKTDWGKGMGKNFHSGGGSGFSSGGGWSSGGSSDWSSGGGDSFSGGGGDFGGGGASGSW